MRVLHLGAGNLFGGVETLLVTLARRQADCPEMEPEFVLTHEGRLSETLRAAGAPVSVIGPVQFSRPWTVLSARNRLATLLGNRPVDVAVAHMPWPLALCGPTVREAGLPVAFWLHNETATGWVDRLAARTRPDLVIANSHFTAGTLNRMYRGLRAEVLLYPTEFTTVVRDAVARRAMRESLTTAENSVVIVQVSRMEPWKGHVLHLEALARLAARSGLPEWTAWFVGGAQKPGEAEYAAELKSQAERAGIGGRVRWLGHRSDVPAVLAAADLFCQPNRDPEPFGLVFVEALAAGLPAVSINRGGAAEIVNSQCGRLTPPGDAEQLAGVLAELVGDAELRRRLGSAGPARAAELCDPARQIPRLAALLAQVRARAAA